MGGWASEITQKTILNPKLVKETYDLIKLFESYLQSNYNLNIEFIRMLGSTYYFEKDIKENPNKIYGDIDFLVKVPYLPKEDNEETRDHENKSIKHYKNLLHESIQNDKEIESVNEGTSLIFNVNGKYVQVDLMYTLEPYVNWCSLRYVPEYGHKGFVNTYLYSAFYNLYNIMIGERGVVVRFKNNKIVSSYHRKNVKIETISINPSTFFYDIVKYFCKLNKKHINWFGINSKFGLDPNLITTKELVKGFFGLADMLESNGLLDNDVFPDKTADDMKFRLKTEYRRILLEILDKPKFKKAKSKLAFESIEKYKKDIAYGISIIESMY